jgi:NAD-dependent dihydropyrimidine dehydrogenase PreA subunit
MPYPVKGFDINLSPVRGGFVVEIGTERGEHLVTDHGQSFREATAEEVSARDKNRKEMCDKLKLSVATMGLPPKDSLQKLVKKGLDNKTWANWAEKCVECGACTHACPTCHCFLLCDQKVNNNYIKVRTWDSCQYYGFAIVAGGATPRPKLGARLRNRYEKKFDYFPEVIKQIACTGCGRCIEACLGKIDMREVFKDLAK